MSVSRNLNLTLIPGWREIPEDDPTGARTLQRTDAAENVLRLSYTAYEAADESPASESSLIQMAVEAGQSMDLTNVQQTASGKCAFGLFGTAVFTSAEFPRVQIWYLYDGQSFIHPVHLCATTPALVEIEEAHTIVCGATLGSPRLQDSGRMQGQRVLDTVRRADELTATVDQVLPIIVPSDFTRRRSWNGPLHALPTRDLAVCWVIPDHRDTMLYVSDETARRWENAGIEWKRVSMENLARVTGDQIYSHEKRDSGGKLEYVILMHDDGFGPSRLLLHDELDAIFPDGYRIAIPERSCAIVFPSALSGSSLREVLDLVASCFKRGSSPVSNRIFDVGDVVVPSL